MMRVYILVVIVTALTKFSGCYKYEDERRLMAYLFNTSRYDKNLRPVHDSTTPTKVTFSQSIRSIMNVDVSTGLMCSYSYITFSWTDELLTWNTTDYGGITEVSLPSGKIWNPELEKTFAGACKDIDDEERFPSVNITLTNQGSVFMLVIKSIGAMCGADMTYYPFDRHLCVHNFYSLRYTPNQLTIHHNQSNDVLDVNTYQENQEWNVLKTELYLMNITEQNPPYSVSYVGVYITLKRRPSFILINNFAPSWLLSFLNLFTPLVPPDSERLSFAVTIYLAMAFLGTSYVAEMPRNSVEIILLSKYLVALNIISTIGIIWSIFIVCLSNTSAANLRIPTTLQKLVGNRSKCINIKTERSISECSDTNKTSSEPEYIVGCTDGKNIGWYDVTRYFDKIFFVFCVLVVGVTNGILFQNIYVGQFEEMKY